MNKKQIRFVTTAAVIASIYAIITILLPFMGYGPIQVRISEALSVLPAITPAAIPGLFVGCLIANLITANVFDIVFGSLATLIAAILTYYLRKKKWLIPFPPVIINAVAVGLILTFAYQDAPEFLLFNILTVGAGQFIACYIIGLPLLQIFKKNKDRLGL